jgi:hypothetical protein
MSRPPSIINPNLLNNHSLNILPKENYSQKENLNQTSFILSPCNYWNQNDRLMKHIFILNHLSKKRKFCEVCWLDVISLIHMYFWFWYYLVWEYGMVRLSFGFTFLSFCWITLRNYYIGFFPHCFDMVTVRILIAWVWHLVQFGVLV